LLILIEAVESMLTQVEQDLSDDLALAGLGFRLLFSFVDASSVPGASGRCQTETDSRAACLPAKRAELYGIIRNVLLDFLVTCQQ
jgi:hypothetical protein